MSFLPSTNKKWSIVVLFFLLLFGLILGLGTVLYLSFFYYELADEGFYHYLLIQGPSTVFLSPFYLIFHYVGSFFDHQLLGYRFLKIGLSFFATWVLARMIWRFLFEGQAYSKMVQLIFEMLVVLCVFSSFSKHTTLSYNVVSYAGAALWAAAFFYYLKDHSVHYVRTGLALSLAMALAFFGRPPFGGVWFVVSIPLLFLGAYWGRFSSLKLGLVYLSAGIFWAGMSLWGFFPVVTQMAEVARNMVATSHTDSSFGLIGGVGSWIVSVMLFILPAWFFIFRKASVVKLRWFVGLVMSYSFLVLGVNLFKMDDYQVRHFLMIFLSAVGWGYWFFLLQREGWTDFVKDRWLVFLTCSFLGMLSSLGTNVVLLIHVSEYAFPLMAIPCLVFVFDVSAGYTRNKMVSFGTLGVLGIGLIFMFLQGGILSAYRNQGFSEQLVYSRYSSVLSGVRMSSHSAQNIDAIMLQMREAGFDQKQDRLVVYGDGPGFVAATGARSLGSAWIGLESDHQGWTAAALNYMVLDLKNEPVRSVYFVVLSSDMDPDFRKGLATFLEKDAGFLEKNIGVSGQYCVILESFRPYRVKWEGPYRMIRRD